MECFTLKEKLADYIDGNLSDKEKLLADDHLASCRKCQLSLSELDKTVRLLKGLDEKNPPPWLTRQIMSKVTGTETRQGLFSRLFHPIHIKLPLQAAGAVLIAITAFYIFKTMPQETGTYQMLSEEVPSERSVPGQTRGKDVGVKPPLTGLHGEKKSVLTAPADAPALPASEEPASSSKKPGIAIQKDAVPPAPAPLVEQEKRAAASAYSEHGKMRENAFSKSSETDPSGFPRQEKFIFNMTAEDPAKAMADIEKAALALGAEDIVMKSALTGSILTLKLDQGKVESLYASLAKIGTVKEQKGSWMFSQDSPVVLLEIFLTPAGLPVR